MGAITFTTKDKRFESAVITASSPNIGLHIEFENPKNNEIVIYRSATGDNFAAAATIPFSEKVFDTTLVGAVSGLQIKITTKNAPSNGQYI